MPCQGNHTEGFGLDTTEGFGLDITEGFGLDMTTREMLVGPGEGYTCRVSQLRWLLPLMLSAIPWRWTGRWGVSGPKFIEWTATAT